MGVSTDGLLFYGFEVGGSESEVDHLNYLRLHDEEYERTPEQIEELASAEDFDEYGKDSLGSVHAVLWELVKKDEWKGIELVNVCSGDCDLLYLTHQDVSFLASRGCPVEISPAYLTCPAVVRNKLKAFCERFRIPWRKPQWMLGSYWG